jgi:hypothetical protein
MRYRYVLKKFHGPIGIEKKKNSRLSFKRTINIPVSPFAFLLSDIPPTSAMLVVEVS